MIISAISNAEIPIAEAVCGKDIRDGIFDLICSKTTAFSRNSYISVDELNKFRRLYLTNLVAEEHGELAAIDVDVLNAIRDNSILSENIEDEKQGKISLGDKLADHIATFGGSWTFIISFFSFLALWIIANVWFLNKAEFYPYPFILLNLILSCLAAIQAPIIMMSQNRQEQKDRSRAEHDYKINLKAELEIKLLSEKMDHILVQQNKKLLEIQEVQIDYLEDLMRDIKNK